MHPFKLYLLNIKCIILHLNNKCVNIIGLECILLTSKRLDNINMNAKRGLLYSISLSIMEN